MTDFTNGLIAGVLAGGGMGCIAGFTVAALCAAAGRADDQAELDAAEFTDPETVKYGPVTGLIRHGDQCRPSLAYEWGPCKVFGVYPLAGWEYRRPITSVNPQ